MKEDIEDLIRVYKRRIESLTEMVESATSDNMKLRLISKRSVYKTVVADLNYLLKEDGD